MTRILRTLVLAGSGSLLVLGAAISGASAHVGGYGDGGPGPEDLWNSQHLSRGVHERHAMNGGGGCGIYRTKLHETGSNYWRHRLHECEQG